MQFNQFQPLCVFSVQALIRGFTDRDAVDEMLKKQSRTDEKIKVALGTLRTKVVVEESEWCCGCDGRGYFPFHITFCKFDKFTWI